MSDYELPFWVHWGDEPTDGYSITGDYVDNNEEYIENGLSAAGFWEYIYSGTTKERMTITDITPVGSSTYKAGLLQSNGTILLSGFSISMTSSVDGHVVVSGSVPRAWFSPYSPRSGSFSCNVPIFHFDDTQKYNDYLNTNLSESVHLEALSHAINFGSDKQNIDESTNDFYIYNRYESASVNRGIVTPTSAVVHQANERIAYNGTDICLYRDDTNPFLLTIKCGTGVVGSIYSNTSVEEVSSADYSQFTLDEIIHTTPFYSSYESRFEVTDYEGYLAIGLSTNLPIWDNENDADDFLSGNKDITESSNWNKISGDNVYKNIIDNKTGIGEEVTEFGEVYVRNIFSQMYLCNTASLYEISNSLFDYDVTTLSGLWEDIKKGLEMYGSNPMDAVQGLRFYPFDLTSIFTDVSPQSYIYFGAYKQELTNSVYKMIYANGYKDLGSVTIMRSFKDWRDFEPYTKLSIYLPYVGRFPLDLKKYYGKTVNIRYYLDVRTGACCACLIANGILLDWFDGVIGTEMPITLTDYSSYANNQLNIIMRNAGLTVTGEGVVGAIGYNKLKNGMAGDSLDAAVAQREAGAFASLESQTAGAGIASGVMSGIGFGAAIAGVAAAGVMKTQFDLLRNGTAGYTRSRPGSSAMINQFLPQYPTFMFEIQEIDESPYLNELYGRPSNASGVIGDFSGYLEAEDVMLICPIATDNERQEIIDLVRSGIYL